MSSKNWKPVKPPFKIYKKEVFKKAAKVTSLVYQIGESDTLRSPSHLVSVNNITSSEMKKKINYLKSCFLKYRMITGMGRGMAAVQVGISEKFAVIYTPENLITIINPKITNFSKKLLKYPEICMSAVPIIVPLARPSWIELEYYDESGVVNKWVTKDDTEQGRILNRVFQHEIDHLEGVVNVDLVKSPKELILESDPSFYKNAKFEEI